MRVSHKVGLDLACCCWRLKATFVSHSGEDCDGTAGTHITQVPAGAEKPPLAVNYEDKKICLGIKARKQWGAGG